MTRQPLPRRILYAATTRPGETSSYRLEALRRLGQQVSVFPMDEFETRSRYLGWLKYRYPVGPLIAPINRALQAAVREQKPDVVWFDKPVQFHAGTLDVIKKAGALSVCLVQDNPFGPRDDGCWMQFYKVLRLFDLHCLVREVDVVRYRKWGLPYVKLLFSYDPLQHFPPPEGWGDADRLREVSYTGSPLEERPAFLQALAETQEVPLVVAGPRWDRIWPPELQAKYVTGGMMKDAAYRESIWKSKVNLAFVTHKNQDDVAHKAMEITACAQFLLAERAPGHQECFDEGMEAEFFDSVEECGDKAKYYLNHPAQREAIAAAGRRRCASSGYDNDTQLAKVLWKLDGVDV
jgi:spore maturation protein CgeB